MKVQLPEFDSELKFVRYAEFDVPPGAVIEQHGEVGEDGYLKPLPEPIIIRG